MPFEFKNEKRKHPREFGGSPFKALLAEVGDFSKQHRRHSLRRYAGLDKGAEAPAEETAPAEECEACAKGECDDPEHMSPEDRGALEEMLKREGTPDDHDFEE